MHLLFKAKGSTLPYTKHKTTQKAKASQLCPGVKCVSGKNKKANTAIEIAESAMLKIGGKY